MPLYEFQCQCGLLFEARASIADRLKPKPCPHCGEGVSAIPPSSVSGHFTKDVTGAGPQNTGIHDLDTHIDRVIGQSARQGWRVTSERVRDKQALVADGTPANLIRKNPDGSYGVMRPEEKAVHERALKIHEKAGLWRLGRRR